MDLEKLIAELRKRLGELNTEMRKTVEVEQTRALNDEEKKKYADLEADYRATDEKLKRAEEQLARENGLTVAEQRGTSVARVTVTREEGEDEEGNSRRWRSLGEQLLAIYRAGRPGGTVDERLVLEARAASGASANVDSDGGYLIAKDFVRELWKRAFERTALARKARWVPISGQADGFEQNALVDDSRATGSRYGGVRVFRIKEADTVTASKLKFRRIKQSLEELMGIAYMTDRMLADAPQVEAILRDSFEAEAAFKLDDETLRGDGAGEFQGILTAPATLEIAKEGSQAADTLLRENVVKMRTSAFRFAESEWYANEEIIPQLETMYVEVGPTGAKTSYPVYVPAGGISNRPYDTLYGRPINYIEHASALGDRGDIMLLNMNEYQVIYKGADKWDQSIHVRFLYAETAFRFMSRNNGMPLWDKPVTVYKGAVKRSPFVVLADRA